MPCAGQVDPARPIGKDQLLMICAWIIPVLTGRHAVRWPGGHKSAPWVLPTLRLGSTTDDLWMDYTCPDWPPCRALARWTQVCSMGPPNRLGSAADDLGMDYTCPDWPACRALARWTQVCSMGPPNRLGSTTDDLCMDYTCPDWPACRALARWTQVCSIG